MIRWRPQLAYALLSLLLVSRAGLAQEHAAPPPPWGEALPNDAEADHGFLDRLRDWCDIDAAPPPKIWVCPEYVLAYIRSSNLPPLVTTGPSTDLPTPGAIGRPFTAIQYGGGTLDYNDRAGFRIAAGATIGDERGLSIEGSYLTLGGRTQDYLGTSPGNPVLARPFFNAVTNQQDSSVTTYPGFFSGTILVESSSYLQSEELNVFADAWTAEKCRIRGLAGFRHVGLHEALSIAEASTVVNPGLPQFGQTVQVRDSFGTTNNLYGAQVGLIGEYRFRRFTMELFGKAALGDLQQRVTIEGSTGFAGQTFPGGLLATTSNAGSYVRDQFGVVPEGGAKLEMAICKNLKVHAGYSFLYFGNVVRPGSQVDLTVNPNLVPTSATFGAGANPPRPAFVYRETDYWAHLFNFGFTVQY